MPIRRRSRGWARGITVAAALYALFVLLSPALHHDFECHLKSPSHCTACTASPLAPRVERGLVPEPPRLNDAGDVQARPCAVRVAILSDDTAGRAPPA